MTDQEYLEEMLAGQDLADDSSELKELREHRKDVEKILNETFSESSPTMRYGGSKAKGTLIKEYYDLDLVCYFSNDDTKAGNSLEDIYRNVRDALADRYQVQEKNSALRLRGKNATTAGNDFHIDVVPGRYTDDSRTDCFLHQNQGSKERLKTNLQTHIDHIRGSGVVEAIRLLKLWKVRRGLTVKQFVFELLVIKVLAGRKNDSLPDQVRHVLEEITDAEAPIAVEDPANPSGNDLMHALRGGTWTQLSGAAALTLNTLKDSGWEGVFGPVKKVSENARVARVEVAAAAVPTKTRPWYPHE